MSAPPDGDENFRLDLGFDPITPPIHNIPQVRFRPMFSNGSSYASAKGLAESDEIEFDFEGFLNEGTSSDVSDPEDSTYVPDFLENDFLENSVTSNSYKSSPLLPPPPPNINYFSKTTNTAEKNSAGGGRYWSVNEHQRFLVAAYNYGNDARKISDYVGTRDVTQTRTHYQKYQAKVARERDRSQYNNSSELRKAEYELLNDSIIALQVTSNDYMQKLPAICNQYLPGRTMVYIQRQLEGLIQRKVITEDRYIVGTERAQCLQTSNRNSRVANNTQKKTKKQKKKKKKVVNDVKNISNIKNSPPPSFIPYNVISAPFFAAQQNSNVPFPVFPFIPAQNMPDITTFTVSGKDSNSLVNKA
ncbi:hypothetical protein PCE1_004351 [Barthelona sp. PCE]